MLLQIISPNKTIFKGQIISLTVPGEYGEFQILKNHANIATTLTKGNVNIKIKKNYKKNDFIIDENIKINQTKNILTYLIHDGLLKLNENKIILFTYENKD